MYVYVCICICICIYAFMCIYMYSCRRRISLLTTQPVLHLKKKKRNDI